MGQNSVMAAVAIGLVLRAEGAWAQRQAATANLLKPTGFAAHGMPDPWTADCALAVGRHHLVAAVNQRVRFFTKSGRMTFDQGLVGPGEFLDQPSLLPFGSGAGDPVCAYDPYADRFYLVTLVRNPDMLTLSVSDDGDPNGTWHKFAIDMESFGDEIDFPDVGFDEGAIHVFARFENMSSAATRGKYCFSFDKPQALAGITPSFQALLLNDFFGSYTFASVRTLEPAPAQYLVWTQALFGSVARMRLVAIQDALGTPIVSQVNVTVPTWHYQADIPQGGSAIRLLTQPGCSFKHAVYRHGSLWATHNVGKGSADRTLARWYEVQMNGWPTSGLQPTLAQSGEVNLGLDSQGAPISTFYPSLDVDAFRNVVLTFNRVSANEPISLMHGVHRAVDPPGVVSYLPTLRVSSTPHPIGSWVDYSTTQADPFELGVFWGHGEFRTTQPTTWVSRIQIVP
ncbi:MAG: hypothetical protein EXS08_03900 [Planctomycetes bacterium]|nr:hypothetical protein [Planctomycetota bacterium]